MDPFTFSLVYISIGFVALNSTWIGFALREHKGRSLLSLRSTIAIQGLLNTLHIISSFFVPLSIGYLDIPYRAFGLTLFTVGVAVAIWARVTMGKYWNMPGTLTATTNPKLVVSGPFEYTRNPIYVGIILVSFGIAIALKSIFFIFGFFLYVHLYMKVREEEVRMQKHFGDEYTKYRISVPRFI